MLNLKRSLNWKYALHIQKEITDILFVTQGYQHFSKVKVELAWTGPTHTLPPVENKFLDDDLEKEKKRGE